jgi:Tol biopolymer transport system component
LSQYPCSSLRDRSFFSPGCPTVRYLWCERPSGANGRIAFHSNRGGNFDIFTMTATGKRVTNFTRNRDDDTWPSWSANGKRIAYAYAPADGSRLTDIYTMTSMGKNKTRRTNHPSNDLQPSWSPDGTRIAFVTERDGNDKIYVVNVDGTGETSLTTGFQPDAAPAWSPNRTKIAFHRNLGNSEIFVMNAEDANNDGNGDNPTNLTNNTAGDFNPVWSPDGQQIAFASDRDGNFEIYMMPAGGDSEPTRLTNNAASDGDPAWSPDGIQIAFTSARDGDSEIFVMDAEDTDNDGNGDNPINLTNNLADDLGPDWQPRP